VGVVPTRSMRPVDTCGYRLSDAATSVRLDGPVIGGGWWIQAEYESDEDTSVRFTAGDSVHEMDLPAGHHTAFFSAVGTFRTVQVQHDGGDGDDADPGLCVTSLVLGLPVPTR
jgi:hypothetical protein